MCHLIDANYEGVPSRADYSVLLQLNCEHLATIVGKIAEPNPSAWRLRLRFDID